MLETTFPLNVFVLFEKIRKEKNICNFSIFDVAKFNFDSHSRKLLCRSDDEDDDMDY